MEFHGDKNSCLLFFRYGRAELKQSDHRPILGIIDVEVHKVDEEKREKVFQEALKELGKCVIV